MTVSHEVPVQRCDACGLVLAVRDGPCPQCGSRERTRWTVSGTARLSAWTELSNPPEGFPRPHRLALVELAIGCPLLAVWDGEPPEGTDAVRVRWDGSVYRAHRAEPGERGEGESPEIDARRSPFEPPR